MPPAITAITSSTLITLLTGSIHSSTLLYPSPKTMPAMVSSKVQIRLPAVVQIRKGVIGISSIPAGTEISVRMPGTKRPQNTSAVP